MKLRVRYNGKTKIVNLPDEPLPTCSVLKRNIRECVSEELGLSRDAEFLLSLNGKTSIGNDETLLKDAGLVSGDLLKIIFESDALPPTATSSNSSSSIASKVSQESIVEAPSKMSVAEEELGNEGPSSSTATEDIPCLSPGPMLLQDCGTGSAEVPHILQSLYECDCIKNEFQALCLILHLMMSESGFYIEGHTEHKDVLDLLQLKSYSAEYSHQAGRELKFSLNCMSLGSFILVNGVVQPCTNTEEQVLTLQLKLSDYVPNFNFSTKNSNAAQVYKNLSKLSHQFKENIAYQALNNMREELNLPPIHGFLSLFPELLLRIFSNLDHKSLISISHVCKRFLSIADDDTLWRNLYIRDFKTQPENVQTSWKAMYKRKYKVEKENKRIRREMEDRYRDYQSPWPQFPSPGHVPVPLPEQPFGMIGGEHDLNPSFPYGPFSNQPRNPRSMFPPNHPVHPMNPDNPLPGSRFDPMYPGGFRPGRGGGLMDDDFGGGMGMPFSNRNQRNARNRFNFM